MGKNSAAKLIEVFSTDGFECEEEDPSYYVYAKHDGDTAMYVIISQESLDIKFELWHKHLGKNYGYEKAYTFDELEESPIPESELLFNTFKRLSDLVITEIKESINSKK